VHNIHPLIAAESDILEAIDGVYGYDLSLRGLLHDIETTSPQSLNREGYVNPTVRLVNAILLDAIKLNASDIHFEPEGAFMRLRYRIDGILSQISTLHSSYWPAICVRLKVMAEMNIAETRQPQNGRLTFSVGAREIDLRLASHPTIHGENIVVRILDKSRSLLTLHDLGYSPTLMTQVQKALKSPAGIFIITGPTGCGKTTSLYSMLSYMNAPHLNIMTLEEPVEYQLPLIRQAEVRPLGGMGFEEGVRSILRQDPDIILIGEIRDPGTAKMALRAAMTGHQVFSTLHTNDAFGSIHRLMDLGLHPSMLASNLTAVIAQRLIRRLCLLCKTQRKMTRHEMSLLALSSPLSLYTAKGCEVCRGTGYKGRLALAEIVVFDQELDEALSASASNHQLKSLAQRKGYRSLRQDAQTRVLRGDTSLEEILKTLGIEGAHDTISL
jgi:type II secretory ATPase GspE/PulE/Tfp pilus assembly ATPase PilB-like protein